MGSSSSPAEAEAVVAAPADGDAAAAELPGKDAAFESGSTVLRPGRLRVMHPHVAELLRGGARRHARPSTAAKPAAARHAHALPGREEHARYACAFEEGDDAGVAAAAVAAPGRLVWGKVRDHPWWPGQVFDAADASSDARALRRRGAAVLVAFFWDKTFAWNDADALLPFRSGFPRLAAMAPVAAAVDAALAEVARRVSAGLSCDCDRGAGAGGNRWRQVIDNAGVRDGAYGAPVDAVFTRAALKPEALVGYVAALATEPRGGADWVDLTVAAAQLEALGRWRGATRGLPEYTLVHGIGGGVVSAPAATAKRRRRSRSSAGGGGSGSGSGSGKRRTTTTSRRRSAPATKGNDAGDYEALEMEEDLPPRQPTPQQMSTKIGKLMSRAALHMSLSPVILRANGKPCPPPPAMPAPHMERCAVAGDDEQLPPVSKSNGDHHHHKAGGAGLALNFSSASAVPSPRHLTMIFSRFGPVKEVRVENSAALVIFGNGAHADAAFAGTAKIGSIRASLISFRITSSLPADVDDDDPPQPQIVPLGASPVEALQ